MDYVCHVSATTSSHWWSMYFYLHQYALLCAYLTAISHTPHHVSYILSLAHVILCNASWKIQLENTAGTWNNDCHISLLMVWRVSSLKHLLSYNYSLFEKSWPSPCVYQQ